MSEHSVCLWIKSGKTFTKMKKVIDQAIFWLIWHIWCLQFSNMTKGSRFTKFRICWYRNTVLKFPTLKYVFLPLSVTQKCVWDAMVLKYRYVFWMYRDIYWYFSENWKKGKLKKVERRNVKFKKQRPKFCQIFKKLENIFLKFLAFSKFCQIKKLH